MLEPLLLTCWLQANEASVRIAIILAFAKSGHGREGRIVCYAPYWRKAGEYATIGDSKLHT